MTDKPPEPPLDSETLLAIRKGAEEFNSGKFFECHDTLEEIWQGHRGPARDFFQGLIQLAVGFYHMSNGNLIGAESQISKGLEKLEIYGDSYACMELARLRSEAGGWLERIRRGDKLKGGVSDLPKFRFIASQ
jgi:hypothetical protein